MLRYAITNGAAADGASSKLIQQCADLAEQGVDYLLVREKQLAAGDLARLSKAIVTTVRGTGSGTKVLVAQRVDVAIAAGADGVHLSANSGELTPAQVRLLMPEGLVSVSCHSMGEVKQARDGGASLVLFGPVFGKTVDGAEVTAGAGLHLLCAACASAGETPVFALGGVNPVYAAACIQAGAAGIAGIRMFFGG